MFKIYASGIGSMVALMITVNSLFAEQAGYLLSILVIHLVGLTLVSLILLFRHEKKSAPAPFYLYFGGVIGVFLVLSNNYCFLTLGASLTLAIGIIGQSTGSLITDSTGLLGMTTYPFEPKKIFALAVSLFGVVMMIEEWRLNLPVVILAFVTGMMLLLAMIVNSQLAKRIGIFKGTRVNYLAGLLTTCALMLILQTKMSGSLDLLISINPVLLLGGGIFGVVVVASINFVIPKIPTIYSTLLILIGQLFTGLLIDFLLFDLFSFQKLLGVIFVVVGVFINMIIDHTSVQSASDKLATASQAH